MPRISPATWDELAELALTARKSAYAPYSRFKVGAALLTYNGVKIAGCNVENATYGLCICAERNCLSTAVGLGHQTFFAMAIASQSSPPAPPCGMCLQFMAEFCVDLDLLLVGTKGERERTMLSRLMKRPFRWKGVV